MRIMITGSSGFIGSPLAEVAKSDGHDVHGLDIVPPRVSGYHHHAVDIRESEQVHEVIGQVRPDVLVHLAALHYIPYCNENPDETMATNVMGTRSVLEACEASGVTRLFIASTAAVYRPSREAHDESAEVCPIDIYGLTKVFDEQLVERFAAQTEARTSIGRIFNVYGPGDPNPHVIPEVVAQLQPQLGSGARAVLQLGNLEPARDYVHVTDAAAAVYLLSTSDDVPEGTYNIGSGIATSVSDLVSIAEDVVGRSIEVEQAQARKRKVDRPMLLSDASRLRALGWSPKVELRQGLGSLLTPRR